MALDDLTLQSLQDLASEHEIEGRSSMDKAELVAALEAAGVTVGDTTVEGFQEGVPYSEIPTTPKQFRALQENPALPPERQSAPSPEQLNPQLFGEQARR
jgi:hypothetical protein